MILTGEESGLIGSKHLSKKLKINNTPLKYVINFEMIGTPLLKTPENIYITGFQKSDFAIVSNNLLNEEFIIYEQIDEGDFFFKHADNYPFYTEFNIPSHTISTFNIENYQYRHNVEDEYSKLDISHMEKIIKKTTKLISRLLENDSKIS